jgi:hypothetical protein
MPPRLRTFHVDTVFPRRLRVVFFIEHGTPVGQEAWNLLMKDRDAKFAAAFDAVLTSAAVRAIRTPVRPPHANAIAERWICSARRQ